MPELRTDWLTGRSVFVAENRALRPNEFAGKPASAGGKSLGTISSSEAPARALPNCPFCAGNEHRTPPAVYQKPAGDGRWRIRVVPNAYPAVSNMSGDIAAISRVLRPADLSLMSAPTTCPAIGAHEVIIESPGHVDRMAALSVSELRDVLQAYAERLRHWRDQGRLRYGLVFKNEGPRAGASLAHVHSQLIALPFIPPTVEAEITRAAQQYRAAERCAYCALIEQERSAGTRVVSDDGGFVAFCPFASWQPHEVWLMRANHEPSFELSPPVALDRLADVLHDLLARLETVAPQAHYNLLLRTAPWRGDYDEVCHWRLELLPRTNSLAGLEVATGVHINHLPPERAAQVLRSV